MKLRWSAPYIIVILLVTASLASLVVAAPQSRTFQAGLQALSLPGLARAVPTASPTAQPPQPTATPLPTVTATPLPTVTPTASPTPTKVPVLSRSIFVDQDAQLMHIYENGAEIRTMPCSTGLPVAGKLTPQWVGTVGNYVGTFLSFGTYQDEGWLLFDDFLIHGAPYTWANGVKVYQEMDALGVRPVSHGCVRLSPEDALCLTQWNPKGVPAAISPLTRKFQQ